MSLIVRLQSVSFLGDNAYVKAVARHVLKGFIVKRLLKQRKRAFKILFVFPLLLGMIVTVLTYFWWVYPRVNGKHISTQGFPFVWIKERTTFVPLGFVGDISFWFLIFFVLISLSETFPKTRHAIEAIITASVSALQYIPVSLSFGIMISPLAVYFFYWPLTHPSARAFNEMIERLMNKIPLILFPRNDWLIRGSFFVGRIIEYVGFAIFLLAFVQFLRRHGKLVTTGIYSLVRHPQYFGIMLITFGISVMSWNIEMDYEIFYVWLIQVLGYVILASYEEHHLLREYEKEYPEYKKKVPFIFPLSCPTKIPEPLYSMILVLIITYLSILLLQPVLLAAVLLTSAIIYTISKRIK